MATFDEKQAPGSSRPSLPKVQVSPTASTTGKTPPAGDDAQRAALSPDGTDGYDLQRDAQRPPNADNNPSVTSLGGVSLGPAPDGPTNEPRKKKKKKKRNRNRNRNVTSSA